MKNIENRKKVECIVLSYNALYQLGYCIKSLKECNKDNFYSITVIDNNSNEDVKKWLALQKDIKVVQNDKNKYFTIAYQDYFRKNIDADYIVIMNNDIIVTPDWCEKLYNYMESNADCGIVAPMLVDISGRQVANMGGMKDFCSHKGGVPEQWTKPEENIWTTFAAVMIRKEAFMKVRGFDEQFLFYCSDSDLCLRMLLSGYRVVNLPDSKVRHFHQASTRENPEVMKIGHEDMIKFNRKYESMGIRIGVNREFIKDNSEMLEV